MTMTDRPTIPLTLEVNGVAYPMMVDPRGIFHEALHHHLPPELTQGHKVTIATPAGDEVYPDMFIGESVRHFGVDRFIVTARPLSPADRPFRTIGFDHLAITVADREGARAFFADVLGMQVMRHDPHLTVLTTGPTSLFLFDAYVEQPMTDPIPSRWHHLGFVVDDLEAAYHHLRAHAPDIASDYILLERAERWSLYFHYRNGDANLMVQLSEIKADRRGFVAPQRITDYLYDYAQGRYGVRFNE
ncbi:MAG: VOC family protein [Chloroflexi bacterium]|nr:VOC family protein [Chloroflexota bacterium]